MYQPSHLKKKSLHQLPICIPSSLKSEYPVLRHLYFDWCILLLLLKIDSVQDLYLTVVVALPDHPWLQNAKKAPNVSLGETVKARLQQFSVMNKFKKRALRVSKLIQEVSSICLLKFFHFYL